MFNGKTYNSEDQGRLHRQLERVKAFLLAAEGEWVTLQDCEMGLPGEGTAAITARARDLRKERFGGYTVECRRRPGSSVYEYRMPLDEEGAL